MTESKDNVKINYIKRKNEKLLSTLETAELMNMEQVQNYVPIYDKFFNTNETNYDTINLNHLWHIVELKAKKTENIFNAILKSTETTKSKSTDVFCKVVPLVDPYKYMIGKDFTDTRLFNIPKKSNLSECHESICDPNNSGYVDGLFVYFTNLLHTHFNFLHGVEYYGCCMGIKKDLKVNVYDDIEYLVKSSFFNKHKNKDFNVEDYSRIVAQLQRDEGSYRNRPIIKIHSSENKNIKKSDTNKSNEKQRNRSKSGSSIKSIQEDMFDDIFDVESSDLILNDETDNLISLDELAETDLQVIDVVNDTNEKDIKLDKPDNSDDESSSNCSSRTSHTSNSNGSRKDGESSDEDSDDYSDSGSETESDESDEIIMATIPRYPVELVFMEKMEYTLDKLMINNDLTDDEWFSILMQIIMILITYQHIFSFTHNDLHTNNVMFTSTNKKFLYYRYKGDYYKVPTYGRIAKIIDFGRSIYKYNDVLMCSDSFKPGQDAATQYNTEPYFNESKPRLEPNMSFDLCRLACSIYDELIEDEEEDLDNPVSKLIYEWCLDDNGLNILYKKNGDERYPSFKLYKMIARHVHNHTPDAQLNRPEFKSFKLPNKDIDKKFKKFIMDIDNITVFKNSFS